MKCNECDDYINGKCSAIPDAIFQAAPESECVFDEEIDRLEQEPAEEIRMPFPGMKWEDIERRYADNSGTYLLMKDGSLLHSADGTDWIMVEPSAFSGAADAAVKPAEQPEDPLPAAERDTEWFSGTKQNPEKLALCRRIMELADGLKRVAPYHIRVTCGELNSGTEPGWMLTLDLHSPTVFISLPMRKRLCELLTAADEVIITAVPEEGVTRFSCIVTDLWR